MAEMEIDNHEAMEVVRLISPAVDVEIAPLNSQGWADYRWRDINKQWVQLERKTVSDLLSTADIEEQLREQKQRNPDAELRLLIEGVIEPAPTGVIIYSRQGGRNAFAGKYMGTQAGLFKRIAGWEYQVQKFAEVYYSSSWAASAAKIVEMYQNDQEESHSTFRRHFKPMIWHPNPQVKKLLGLASNDTGIGVQLAERLIAKFGTVWNVASAQPMEIAEVTGISQLGAKKFLQAIGRMDV